MNFNLRSNLLSKLNSSDTFATDSSGLDASIATLTEIFGEDVDMEAIKADMLAGKLDADNICKRVPNWKKTEDEVVVEFGVPATASEEDAAVANPAYGVPISPVHTPTIRADLDFVSEIESPDNYLDNLGLPVA